MDKTFSAVSGATDTWTPPTQRGGLTFSNAELERAYANYFIMGNLQVMRSTYLFLLIFLPSVQFVSWKLFSSVLDPAYPKAALWLALLVQYPLAITPFFRLYGDTRKLDRTDLWVSNLMAFLLAMQLLLLAYYLPIDDLSGFAFAGLIAQIMGCYALPMAQVRPTSLANWVSIAAFLGIGMAREVPTSTWVVQGVTFLSAATFGQFIVYQIEKQSRRAFVQNLVIADQRQKLDAETEKSETLLRNVLPPAVVARLKLSPESIAERFENVSVLFADIVGFTSMSEKIPPEAMVGFLNGIFSQFDQLSDQYSLEKIKTIGDAYMVAGGLPKQNDNHAESVARLALNMLAVIESAASPTGDKLQMRIGICSGPVVAGVIGKRKFIYDLWGDTVNTASRMESHGEPSRIQVTESTFLALEHRFNFSARGEIDVKGKGRVRTWYLEGPKESANEPLAANL